jgi:L-lactate dehydrogenase complex protein LldF
MSSPREQFITAAELKAGDINHRHTIRKNMDTYDTSVARGKLRFLDWQAARTKCSDIKEEALSGLADYLEQFEAKILERGGHIYWADTAEDARKYVVDLAVARGVKTVVKSKSMVTEEIHLSEALEAVGCTAWETDLGEFIVQLRKEPPYHIVTPAMHLTRVQIGDLFREKIDPTATKTNDPGELVAVARKALRKAFFSAEMGISGANFLVADAGMVAISTNEGNGRLTTSVPRIHVVMTGIEKIIPRLTDLAALWPVLATAGTGQPITTYSTLIGGPRRDGEADGPEEFHVVLLDNGRTAALANKEQQEVLKCLRCGACLNACPVYRQIGGHTYGAVYPGPIGSVLMPLLGGEEKFGHLPFASSLCTACADVCPVKIDLPKLLVEHRHYQAESGSRAGEARMFRLWKWAMMKPSRYRFMGKMARGFGRMLPAGLLSKAMGPWTKYREPMEIPAQSFREMWKKEAGNGGR